MSYCVNCGVELHESARECPLCQTPVINPKRLEEYKKAASLFPEKAEPVEIVKKKDMAIFMTSVLAATAVTCGILNHFVFPKAAWSTVVIGVCIALWVMSVPKVIFAKLPGYVALLLDGAAVGNLLFMVTFLTGDRAWLYGLGLPITVFITFVLETLMLCMNKLPKSFLTGALYVITAVALVCGGVDLLIRNFFNKPFALGWSAIVITVCVILDIAVITLLSRRRLRNEVRRRLHF